MNRIKIFSISKFKRCLFLVVFLLLLNSIFGQDIRNCMDIDYELKCNKYNALYYGRENEITIKYDTIKYPGDITFDFDTTYVKNIVRVNKLKYKFSIENFNDWGIVNPIRNSFLTTYYSEKKEKVKLKTKDLLFVDTNTWFSYLICDSFYVHDDHVPYRKFIDYLFTELMINKRLVQFVYIVKNDNVIKDYRDLKYCIVGVDEHTNSYTKWCKNKSGSGGDVEQLYISYLRYLYHWSPIYIENIEVTDFSGKKRYFPPMKFNFLPY